MVDQEQQSRWRPTRRQLLWAGGIAALAFLILVICGYLFGWKWTGLPKRTFWDWLDLLIVPLVLAIGGYLFTRSENRATQAAAERRAQDEALQAYLDQMAAMLVPNKDLPSLYKARPGDSLSSVARARTLTVLPRLDGDRKARVVQFLYESGLISSERPVLDLSNANLRYAELSYANLSEAYLSRADLSQAKLSEAYLDEAYLHGAYLSGADLSYANLSEAYLREADLSQAKLREAFLRGADLSVAYLRGAYLSEANLNEADLGYAHLHEADLSYAALHGANLGEANLSGANLSGAYLGEADLSGAYLGEAYLSGAYLSGAYLGEAYLGGANLSGADLGEADLGGANLSGADLSGAYRVDSTTDWEAQLITNEELERQAGSLDGATMPNGQKYEDWLKSKGRGEDGENSGPS